MMTVNGRTYPFSPGKFMLPDTTWDQLKALTRALKQQNNNYTVTLLINQYYNTMIQVSQLQEKEKVKPTNETEQSLGTTSSKSTDRDSEDRT